MLKEEPDQVVDNCNEDTIGEHFESELCDSLSVEHHIKSSCANSQVEEIRSQEHHKDCDEGVE